MAEKQMFKALVMVELLDSGEEEGTKGGRMTRGWLKEIGELQSGRGIWSGMGGRCDWTGQGEFDIYFCVFFGCCCRGLVSRGRLGAGLCLRPNLRFS